MNVTPPASPIHAPPPLIDIDITSPPATPLPQNTSGVVVSHKKDGLEELADMLGMSHVPCSSAKSSPTGDQSARQNERMRSFLEIRSLLNPAPPSSQPHSSASVAALVAPSPQTRIDAVTPCIHSSTTFAPSPPSPPFTKINPPKAEEVTESTGPASKAVLTPSTS